MIHVERVDYPEDVAWVDAVQKGRAKRDEHIAAFAAGETFKVDGKLYKQFAKPLRRLFRNKCAYCDQKYVTMEPGDVEHYRPKGGIVETEFDLPRPDEEAARAHPGYFWLAYEWRNLLPSCTDCNRYRGHETEDDDDGGPVGAGKGNFFPVQAFRAFLPDTEKDEAPLLLNPCDVDPAEHIRFGVNGWIMPLTREGQVTVQLLGLNIREEIVEVRTRAFREATDLFRKYLRLLAEGRIDEANEEVPRLNACWAGEEGHTAMQRLAFRMILRELAEVGWDLRFPLLKRQKPAAEAA